MEVQGETKFVLQLGDFVGHPIPKEPFDMLLLAAKMAAKKEKGKQARERKKIRRRRREKVKHQREREGAAAAPLSSFDFGVPCSSEKRPLDLTLRLSVGSNDNVSNDHPPMWSLLRPSNNKRKRAFSSSYAFDHGTRTLPPKPTNKPPFKNRTVHPEPIFVQPLRCVAPSPTEHVYHHATAVGNNVNYHSAGGTPGQLKPLLEEAVLKRYVEEVGGYDLGLVIQKELTATDVNPTQCRLSIPHAKMKAPSFLTPEEKSFLELRNPRNKALLSIPVTLLQPNLEPIAINFKKWDMRKESGKVNSSYVLVTTWNKVVETNRLEEGHFIQLWSFRRRKELCLALVTPGPTIAL